MTSLGAADIALLSSELPLPMRVEIKSSLYATGRGYAEFRASGAAHAPPIMLLHGIGSSSVGYRAQLAGLSTRCRVIAWNAPGFGASTPLAEKAPDVNQYAQILALLLEALQIQRLAALVGSSWGSVIAMAFAELYPKKLDSLALSAPNTARGHLTGAARTEALELLIASGNADQPIDRKANADRLLPRDAPQQVRNLVEQLRDAVTPIGWRQAAHMLFSVHTPSIIGQIRCPIEMMVGSLDTVAPIDKHAGPLRAVAPSIPLHLFEGCGHMLKLEAPTKFNDVVHGMALVPE
jgi:pimeloyl-ACP methyl ester carboxylesterase